MSGSKNVFNGENHTSRSNSSDSERYNSEKEKSSPRTNSSGSETPQPITSEPDRLDDMSLAVPDQNRYSRDHHDDLSTFQTISEAGSGYHRERNECTEFCVDFFSCFGLCDACCPSNEEGCLNTVAVFCGTACIGACKC